MDYHGDLSIFLKERLKQFKKMADINAVFLIFGFGWAFVAPIFNIRINEVTGSLFLSGIIIGMWGLVRLFTDIPVGMLNDKFSSKRLIQISFLGYIVITLLYVYVGSFAEIFLLRFFHSIIGSFLWISSWTYTRRISVGAHASERVSLWYSIRSLPNIIGPLIGGLVITLINWEFSFYLLSLFMLFCFLYTSFKLDKLKVKHNVKRDIKTELRHFFKNRGLALRISSLTIIYVIIAGIYGNYLPLFMQDRGFNIEQISIVIGLAASIPWFIFSVPVGIIGDKYGKRWPIFFGLIMSGITLSLIFSVNSLFDILLATFIIQTGLVFVTVALNSKVTDLFPKGEEGSITGIYEVMKDIGVIIGPVLGGYLAQTLGFTNAFMIAGFISILSSFILIKRIVTAKT